MKVKFFATYRDFTGCKETAVTAPVNVRELLLNLGGQYGAAFKNKLLSGDGEEVGEETIVLVNGRNVAHLEGVNTPLNDSDIVSVFPLVAGG